MSVNLGQQLYFVDESSFGSWCPASPLSESDSPPRIYNHNKHRFAWSMCCLTVTSNSWKLKICCDLFPFEGLA